METRPQDLLTKIIKENNIMGALKSFLKIIGIMLFGGIIVILIACAAISYPYYYLRKTYDLGDKYMSCEWVNYSDSCRMIIVSKDGLRRAVLKDATFGAWEVYFKKVGTDTIFFPGHKGEKVHIDNVIEVTNIVFEYSTGVDLVYDTEIKDLRNDYGGFEHLFSGKDLRTLKDSYINVIAERGNEWEWQLPCPKPERVVWIWPLKNPLLKRYPFDKKSIKSKVN